MILDVVVGGRDMMPTGSSRDGHWFLRRCETRDPHVLGTGRGGRVLVRGVVAI